MEKMGKIYEFINDYINDRRISNEEKFGDLFLLICQLIDAISDSNDSRIKDVLNMLNEYDFEKNREITNGR